MFFFALLIRLFLDLPPTSGSRADRDIDTPVLNLLTFDLNDRDLLEDSDVSVTLALKNPPIYSENNIMDV